MQFVCFSLQDNSGILSGSARSGPLTGPPPSPGFGGPADFGETNAEVRIKQG